MYQVLCLYISSRPSFGLRPSTSRTLPVCHRMEELNIVMMMKIMKKDICKAPILRLKLLNNNNITHNVYHDRECYLQFNKQLTHNADINNGSGITLCKMHTHTHTHTHVAQTGSSEGQSRLTLSRLSAS